MLALLFSLLVFLSFSCFLIILLDSTVLTVAAVISLFLSKSFLETKQHRSTLNNPSSAADVGLHIVEAR